MSKWELTCYKCQAVVVAFQIGEYDFLALSNSISATEGNFLEVLRVIVNGALVPLIVCQNVLKEHFLTSPHTISLL